MTPIAAIQHAGNRESGNSECLANFPHKQPTLAKFKYFTNVVFGKLRPRARHSTQDLATKFTKRMQGVFGRVSPFKIGEPVVMLVAILMICIWSCWINWKEGVQDQAMNKRPRRFAVGPEVNLDVASFGVSRKEPHFSLSADALNASKIAYKIRTACSITHYWTPLFVYGRNVIRHVDLLSQRLICSGVRFGYNRSHTDILPLGFLGIKSKYL